MRPITALTAAFLIGLAQYGILAKVQLVEILKSCKEASVSGNHKECLKITFGDSKDLQYLEYAGLDYTFKDEKTSLNGVLYNSNGKLIQGSVVSLTKHDGIAEAIISDPGDNELYMLEVNLTSWKVTPIESPLNENVTYEEPLLPPNDDRALDRMPANTELDRALSATGYKFRLQMLYDQRFAAKYSDNPALIKEAIDRVVNQAQTFFKLQSLTTKLIFDILPFKKIERALTATGNNINTLRGLIPQLGLPDANSYSLLTYENNAGGTIGIAWVGTTCVPAKDRGYRSNINEHFRSDVKTAQILVHEIGHNLGMWHDFTEYVNTRNPPGRTCPPTDNGFMAYRGNFNRWSTCSVQDFTTYFNKVVKNDGRFCLAAADSPTTPNPTVTTPTSPPTTTPTTTQKPEREGECKDSMDICSSVKYYCNRHGTSYYYFIQLACKETCGFCENGKPKCEDYRKNSSYCSYWATGSNAKYCTGTDFWSIYRQGACRKTCNLC